MKKLKKLMIIGGVIAVFGWFSSWLLENDLFKIFAAVGHFIQAYSWYKQSKLYQSTKP
jgi:uncharacterized membrane protein YfcA